MKRWLSKVTVIQSNVILRPVIFACPHPLADLCVETVSSHVMIPCTAISHFRSLLWCGVGSESLGLIINGELLFICIVFIDDL